MSYLTLQCNYNVSSTTTMLRTTGQASNKTLLANKNYRCRFCEIHQDLVVLYIKDISSADVNQDFVIIICWVSVAIYHQPINLEIITKKTKFLTTVGSISIISHPIWLWDIYIYLNHVGLNLIVQSTKSGSNV